MTIDGNDVESIMSALSTAETVKGKPTCVIAKTIKGKGVSFMENNVSRHGKSLSDEDYRKAVEELTSNTFEYEE
jgi:transketolase